MSTRPGSLRIYLGAAPGVGKTVAMLDEGHRRAGRGTDVVVAAVADHGRPVTAARLAGLEVLAPPSGAGADADAGGGAGGIDVAAVLRRRPRVVLVDDLGACTVSADGVGHRRWEDVVTLLDAGIDVVATLDLGAIGSLADRVEAITGVVRSGRVPDAVVDRAEQVELVDMTPEALRRRLAHGNIVPAEALDSEAARRFELPVLQELRALALRWLADRVRPAPGGPPAGAGDGGAVGPAGGEAGERVVVALSGVAGGDRLIRRAARLAAAAEGGELLGIAVLDGRRDEATVSRLGEHRRLLEQLGGTYLEVRGDGVAETLARAAQAEGATQLVIGAGPRRWFGPSVGEALVAMAEGIDVHVVGGAVPAPPPRRGGSRRRLPDRRRQLVALAMWALSFPAVTAVLVATRERHSLSTALLAYVLVVVAVTSVGGAVVGVLASVAAFLGANYFFTEPLHTFSVTDPENVIALVVFLLVAAIVSSLVQVGRRRAAQAQLAGAEAAAVAHAATVLARSPEPVAGLVEHLGRALSRPVRLERRDGEGWRPVAAGGDHNGDPPDGAAGSAAPGAGGGAGVDLAVDVTHRLRIGGDALSPPSRRLALAIASQLASALQAGELRRLSEQARADAAGDAYRTALLQAVSHDLRTPLTAIKTSVTSLLARDVHWSDEDTAEFLGVIDSEADRLEGLIANLLDMGRLQSGAIHVRMAPTVLPDVIVAALDGLRHLPAGRVKVVLDHPDPVADADPVLLERVVANLVTNAHRASPEGAVITIRVGMFDEERAEIRVVDRGRGIPEALRQRARRPFDRLDDRSPGTGIGLGLAIVEGFVAAMGGELVLDDTPGGGLTAVVRLARPRAEGVGS